MYGPRMMFGAAHRPQDCKLCTVTGNCDVHPPIERTQHTVSHIQIEHMGMTLDWEIDDPVKASQIFHTIWDLVSDRPAAPSRSPRMARQQLTPEFLAEVARVYDAAPHGQKSRAVRDLVGGCSAASASYYVNAARTKGLLPPSERSMNRQLANAVDEALTPGMTQ